MLSSYIKVLLWAVKQYVLPKMLSLSFAVVQQRFQECATKILLKIMFLVSSSSLLPLRCLLN